MNRLNPVWLIVFLSLPLVSFSQFRIAIPISGQHLKDYYIVNHVDHDTTINSIRDFNCGQRTYDGHMGTDFVLTSFKSMDSGVKVLAAESGKVIFIQDGLFDREKNGDPSKTYGNLVIIEHSDSFYTYYAHLKKGSIDVVLGQFVNRGDTIADVGSSGYSTDPHLHFELYYKDTLLDPFGGNCSYFYSGYMQNQTLYDSTRGVIGSGLIQFNASLDTIKEHLPNKISFNEFDTAITFWIHLKGSKKNDVAKIEWISPDTVIWFQFSSIIPADFYYFYWYSWMNNPIQKPGNWQARFYLNDILVNTKEFKVEKKLDVQSLNVFSSDVRIYYNNSGRILNVLTENNISNLDVFDAQGRTIFKYIDSNIREVNIDLLPGIYFVRTQSNSGFMVNKIIVNY